MNAHALNALLTEGALDRGWFDRSYRWLGEMPPSEVPSDWPRWMGYCVCDQQGHRLGHVEDLVVDALLSRPQWVLVTLGSWWRRGGSVLAPVSLMTPAGKRRLLLRAAPEALAVAPRFLPRWDESKLGSYWRAVAELAGPESLPLSEARHRLPGD